MSSSGRSNGSSGSNLSKRPIDPITRTALRYTISPREYELLHQYLISRAPRRVQKRAPEPPRYESITKSSSDSDDYNSAAIRASLRVFAATYAGLKGWDIISQRLASRKGAPPAVRAHGNPNLRGALSYSSILLFHRLLHRFFKRLRASLLEESAEPFRKRNPGITKALTSKFTPAVGASLAGFLLGLSPSDQLRLTVAIYVFSRSLEFGYEGLVAGGFLWSDEKPRPWWFGSWMLMPFACGQLLHAFVFDRDCFPESFGRFILARSPEYIQLRPKDFPPSRSWPGTFDIVDALAELSKLRWPAYVSPILFPNKKTTLPGSATIAKIAPITGPAHPGTKHTSCAILHPHDPSCARTYIKYWIAAFPPVVKFFTLLYGAFALLAYKALIKDPMPILNKVSARILRMSLFITGAIGTSWASICLFANVLPRSVFPTQRWFLGGFLGGMWAFAVQGQERSNFLYSSRLSIESLYRVGKKRGWWRGVQNGDVLLFVASLALTNYIFEAQPAAVKSGLIRKTLASLKGQGWVDQVALAKKEAANAGKEAEKGNKED